MAMFGVLEEVEPPQLARAIRTVIPGFEGREPSGEITPRT